MQAPLGSNTLGLLGSWLPTGVRALHASSSFSSARKLSWTSLPALWLLCFCTAARRAPLPVLSLTAGSGTLKRFSPPARCATVRLIPLQVVCWWRQPLLMAASLADGGSPCWWRHPLLESTPVSASSSGSRDSSRCLKQERSWAPQPLPLPLTSLSETSSLGQEAQLIRTLLSCSIRFMVGWAVRDADAWPGWPGHMVLAGWACTLCSLPASGSTASNGGRSGES